jgi:S1-C subfamily serine protease
MKPKSITTFLFYTYIAINIILISFGFTYLYVMEPTSKPKEPRGAFQPVGDLPSTLQSVWNSTVWIGREVEPGQTAYVESGWVLGNKDGQAYIVTANHGLDFMPSGKLMVAYWNGRNNWTFVPAKIIMRAGKGNGDVAILTIDERLPSLPLARSTKFSVNDEIIIGGVQHDVMPAYTTAGYITEVGSYRFWIRGWAWHGFSGGPIVLRRTGEVIGYVSYAVSGHSLDATWTECHNYLQLRAILERFGLNSIN